MGMAYYRLFRRLVSLEVTSSEINTMGSSRATMLFEVVRVDRSIVQDLGASALSTYVFLIRRLFPRVEFATLVYEFSAAGTLHGKRRHQPYRLKSRTCRYFARASDFRWIPIRRIVFGEHLSFRHVLRFKFKVEKRSYYQTQVRLWLSKVAIT